MTETLNKKVDVLDTLIKSSGNIAIAFSGGVDSSYLLFRAKNVSDNVTAIIVQTPYMVSHEMTDAHQFVKHHNIRCVTIEMPTPDDISNNPPDRCYKCKKALFGLIADYAKDNDIDTIFDGTNADDLETYRPGLKVLKEMEIKSPLAISGITKSEIRLLANEAGLSFWDKPSMTCLLTRIPHNTPIDEQTLSMIEKAEKILAEHGYYGIRVRVHNDIARIECDDKMMIRLVNDENRLSITADIKKAGFTYVSLDLEGYRTGSMDKKTKS